MNEEETYDPRSFLRFLSRRRAVIAGTILLVAGVALVVSLLQTDRYEATATVLFRDPGLDERIFDAPILFGGEGILGGQNVLNSETTIGLVSVDAVAGRAAESLGDKSAAQVGDEIEVREGAGRELIEVTASTQQPEESAATANAYVEGFLELRREADRRVFGRAFRSVEEELDGLPTRLEDTARGERLRRQLRQLEALALMQTGDSELVEQAEPPGSRSSPRPLRNTVLGGLTGLILGLLGGLLLDRGDRRLRSRSDFERVYGAPVLGSAAAATTSRKDAGPEALELAQLDELWTRLRYLGGGESIASVLVVGAERAARSGTVALGLAHDAAAAGAAVVLVEGDLRRPELASRVGAEPEPGLAELVDGTAIESDALRERAHPGDRVAPIRLIPAGKVPSSYAAVLNDPALAALLHRLGDRNDLVVVSGSPLGESADAIPLADACDAVLIVAPAEQPARDAENVRRDLEALGATVAGVVVTATEGHALG